MESCSRIKDGNGRLVLEEAEVRRIWKEYYGDLYNIDSGTGCSYMCGFEGVRRGNYFGGVAWKVEGNVWYNILEFLT